MQEFYSNVSRTGLGYLIYAIGLHSARAAAAWPEESAGVLYIDGLHDYESVSQDLVLWTPKVVDGGIILMHDKGEPGVQEAIESRPSDLFRIGSVDQMACLLKGYHLRSYSSGWLYDLLDEILC
jgi:hypothetical protein